MRNIKQTQHLIEHFQYIKKELMKQSEKHNLDLNIILISSNGKLCGLEINHQQQKLNLTFKENPKRYEVMKEGINPKMPYRVSKYAPNKFSPRELLEELKISCGE